jgi:hypothetical protein
MATVRLLHAPHNCNFPSADRRITARVKALPRSVSRFHQEVSLMKFRHRLGRLRFPIIALASVAALAPATATARPADPATAKWQTYEAQISQLSPVQLAAAFGTAVSTAKVGDTPADFPGARRAPKYNGPASISVVRPERTIVRDVDEVLPIVLSSTALLIALLGTGYMVVRVRAVSRAGVGRTP